MKRLLARIFFSGFSRCGKILLYLAFAVMTVVALWCAGAFFHGFDVPAFVARLAVIALFALLAAGLFFRRALLAAAIFETAVVMTFGLITPERRFRDTVWQRPWRRTLEARRLADGSYELYNVRDFHYRSENDFDDRYRTVVVSPERISSIDAVFSHWDDLEGIAHSMLGLNFADGTTVVISLETRLPEGAVQNGLDGFYRRYELAMLAGTPEDLYALRADHRGETLYIYRLKMTHEVMRDTVISIFERAAELQRKPRFYNSLFRNCTTGMRPMLPDAGRDEKCDLRVMLNGFAAKMLFEEDLMVRREKESFGSLRARSLVPGLCRGKDAPRACYSGESEARWLRDR